MLSIIIIINIKKSAQVKIANAIEKRYSDYTKFLMILRNSLIYQISRTSKDIKILLTKIHKKNSNNSLDLIIPNKCRTF